MIDSESNVTTGKLHVNTGGKQAVSTKRNKESRHGMRMYQQDYEMLVYWSEQFGMDKTEFLVAAMHHYIKWRNQDYDLPTAEIQRLNQMVDAVESLASRQESLESTVVSGLTSMLGIIRGDNYLVDDDDAPNG